MKTELEVIRFDSEDVLTESDGGCANPALMPPVGNKVCTGNL